MSKEKKDWYNQHIMSTECPCQEKQDFNSHVCNGNQCTDHLRRWAHKYVTSRFPIFFCLYPLTVSISWNGIFAYRYIFTSVGIFLSEDLKIFHSSLEIYYFLTENIIWQKPIPIWKDIGVKSTVLLCLWYNIKAQCKTFQINSDEALELPTNF